MVLLPVGLLAVLGLRLVHREQLAFRQSLSQLLDSELDEYAALIRSVLEERQRSLLGDPSLLAAADSEGLRRFVRKNPLAKAVFALDGAGNLLHPPPGGPRSREENVFLLRAEPALRELMAQPVLLAQPVQLAQPVLVVQPV